MTKKETKNQAKEKTMHPANNGDDMAQAEKASETEELTEVMESAEDLLAENEALNVELTALKAEHTEKADQLLRLTAEFDNFRRRTLKEKDDLRLTANADLLSSLLPVLDNFERALIHAENSPVLEGILMVQKQLIEILNNNGLTKVGEVGEAFDPKIHDAIMQEERDAAAADTILEVLQPGYRFHDKLLRAAMVKVAK